MCHWITMFFPTAGIGPVAGEERMILACDVDSDT